MGQFRKWIFEEVSINSLIPGITNWHIWESSLVIIANMNSRFSTYTGTVLICVSHSISFNLHNSLEQQVPSSSSFYRWTELMSGRINEWQNRDSKQGRVQSSCLFAVLFLRGLGKGRVGCVLVHRQQTVYLKLQRVEPAGEQAWHFIFSRNWTLLLQYWRKSYWATQSSKQIVSPNYKNWIEHLLFSVTEGNRISTPSVVKLCLICLLSVLERKDLI